MQKLYADGYALGCTGRQGGGMRLAGDMQNVIYYVMKLQMQKEILTSLQGCQKHLYEMRAVGAGGIWPAKRLTYEPAFKTVRSNMVKMVQRGDPMEMTGNDVGLYQRMRMGAKEAKGYQVVNRTKFWLYLGVLSLFALVVS